MGTEHGQDWRIEIVDGANSSTFLPIGGETSFDWERTAKEIDESSKDDVAISSTGHGRSKISFSASGKLKLPDPGIARADAVAKGADKKVQWRIVRGAVVKYEGLVSIGSLSTSFPDDDSCTWKLSANASATPEIDNLGAIA